MSLNALYTATAGLQANQAAIGLVSQNIANANTTGYVRRGLTTIANPGGNAGVATGTVTRQLDLSAQRQLRLETAGAAYTSTLSGAAKRLDALYGTPGSSTALDGVLNTFTQSLQALAASPSTASARATAVGSAATLAASIGRAANGVQSLRTDMEGQLGSDVASANTLVRGIAALNIKIQGATDDAMKADLEDQRDQQIDQLSQYMDVQTSEGTGGAVTVRTSSGLTLVEQGTAAALSFDGRGTLSAGASYSADPAKRGVGTITATTPSGTKMDLIASGAIRSGSIAAGLEMRDVTLPQAQRQLDDLAAGLSRSLSDRQATGTASGTVAGGFAVDLSGLQAGNAITVATTVNGVAKNVIIVPTKGNAPATIDPALTNDPTATVVKVDVSAGLTAAGLQTALGANYAVTAGTRAGSFTFAPSTAGTTAGLALKGVSAGITVPTSAADTQTGVAQLALFVDSGYGNTVYTGSFEGGSHLTGLAQRLAVNPTVVGNNATLVSYAPNTPAGDATRPNALYAALTTTAQTFSAASGIGGVSAPYAGTVSDFAQQVISAQGANASQAVQLDEGQRIALQTAQGRFASASGVSIDTEMANLIALQTAYSANARVLSAAKDMFDTLLRI